MGACMDGWIDGGVDDGCVDSCRRVDKVKHLLRSVW